MKTVDNEAGVKFARKGYYKGVEVTVTHRYGSQVWLEDYPIRHKGSATEWGCWVEGESVTYKDNMSDKEPNLEIVEAEFNRNRESKSRKQNNGYGKNNFQRQSVHPSSSPKGNNNTRNNRGSTRKT